MNIRSSFLSALGFLVVLACGVAAPAAGQDWSFLDSADSAAVVQGLNGLADLRAVGRDGQTAMHAAVVRGNGAAVRELLARGVPADLLDGRGRTALWVAIDSPEFYTASAGLTRVNGPAKARVDDIISALLAAGANPDAADSSGTTPLMKACTVQESAFVKKLLDNGADVNKRDAQGNTAMVRSVTMPYFSRSIIDLLLDHGAVVSEPNAGGEYPLEQFLLTMARLVKSDGDFPPFFTNEVKAVLARFLSSGASWNFPTPRKNSAQNYLAIIGEVSLFETLETAKPDLDARDGAFGNPALYYALTNRRTAVANYLLNRGVKTDFVNGNGENTLLVAAMLGNTEVFDRLWTVRTREVVQQVNAQGQTLLHTAVFGASWSIYQKVVEGAADVNVRNYDGLTPLHLAMYAPQFDARILDDLIRRGAGINLGDSNDNAPLVFGVGYQHRDRVDQLLRYHPDVNKTNKVGKSALWAAMAVNDAPMLKALIDAGGIPTQKLWEEAKQGGRSPEVLALLEQGGGE